jgi:hypothetical protein
MPTAIACAAGAFKGVFTHGVLSAFAAAGFRADAYAPASSTVIPTAYAATGQLDILGGVGYWQNGLSRLKEPGGDMSSMVLEGIATFSPLLRDVLFRPDAPRFLIPASAVLTGEAAAQTQGAGARHLGVRLLLATRTRDRSWADEHLALHLYDTDDDGDLRLTPHNLEAVIYASTRMLHAWKVPAWIGDKPYVDASYTCACPAVEMAERGHRAVIAIATEPGPVYRDLFQSTPIPPSWNGVPIHFVRPGVNLADLGVEFTRATSDGLEAAFRHGQEQGKRFLQSWPR